MRVEWDGFVIYWFYLNIFLNTFRLHLSLTDLKISYASYTPMKSQQVFHRVAVQYFWSTILPVFSSRPWLRITLQSVIIATSLSLIFKYKFSLLKQNFLAVPMYLYLLICTIYVVKFPFICVTIVLTIICFFLKDTQIPFCWCFLSTLHLGQLQRLLSPHGDFSESPPITLEKVFNPPFKRNCCHLILSPASQFSCYYLPYMVVFQVRCYQMLYRSPASFVSSSPQNQSWKNGIELWESKLLGS